MNSLQPEYEEILKLCDHYGMRPTDKLNVLQNAQTVEEARQYIRRMYHDMRPPEPLIPIRPMVDRDHR